MAIDSHVEIVEQEIVAIERGRLAATEAAIAEAGRRAELLSRVTEIAIKRTYPQDWMEFKNEGEQGSPYLGAAGAERLRTLFGISIRHIDVKRYEERDKEGMFWYYVVSADAEWRGDVVAVIGTCSARDQFFRTRYQDGQKVLLDAQDVDPTNIIKAARSNMVANAVTGVLGLRGLTWEQLGRYGITRGAGGVAVFRGGKAKADATQAGAKADGAKTAGESSASGSQVDKLRAMLSRLFGADEGGWTPVLIASTSYPVGTYKSGKGKGKEYAAFGGCRSIADLVTRRDPENAARIAISKIEQMVERGEVVAQAAQEPEVTDSAPETTSGGAVDGQP